MDRRCRNCKWWIDDGEEGGYTDYIIHPNDPDTFGEMAMPFEVRKCVVPKLVRFERPIEANGASVCDGSDYMATLYTAQEFGCVHFEM